MKSPAILFYTSDFMTGTMFLSNEEVGAYIRALCMQHQKGHLSGEDMLKICKTNDIFSSIISYFKKDKKGLYFNKRMEEEIIKRQKYSESRAKNRSISKKTYEKDMKTYLPHMENENENINENINNINKNDNEVLNYDWLNEEGDEKNE